MRRSARRHASLGRRRTAAPDFAGAGHHSEHPGGTAASLHEPDLVPPQPVAAGLDSVVAGGRRVRCVAVCRPIGGHVDLLTTERPHQALVNAGLDLAPTRRANREKRPGRREMACFDALGHVGTRRTNAWNPTPREDSAQQKGPEIIRAFLLSWWWGGTLRQTYVIQRLTTAANSCGKVRNPALDARNPTSSALVGSPTERIRQDASSIPVCGI